MEMFTEPNFLGTFEEFAELYIKDILEQTEFDNPDDFLDLAWTGDDNDDAWAAVYKHPQWEEARQHFKNLTGILIPGEETLKRHSAGDQVEMAWTAHSNKRWKSYYQYYGRPLADHEHPELVTLTAEEADCLWEVGYFYRDL